MGGNQGRHARRGGTQKGGRKGKGGHMFKEIEPGVYEFQYGRWTMDQARVEVYGDGVRLCGEWPDMAPNQARALAVLLLELTRDKAAGTWAEISAKYGGQ